MNFKGMLTGIIMGVTSSGAMAQDIISHSDQVRAAVACIKDIGIHYDQEDNASDCNLMDCGGIHIKDQWSFKNTEQTRSFSYSVIDDNGVQSEKLSITNKFQGDNYDLYVNEIENRNFSGEYQDSMETKLTGIGKVSTFEHRNGDDASKEQIINESFVPMNLNLILEECHIPMS